MTSDFERYGIHWDEIWREPPADDRGFWCRLRAWAGTAVCVCVAAGLVVLDISQFAWDVLR